MQRRQRPPISGHVLQHRSITLDQLELGRDRGGRHVEQSARGVGAISDEDRGRHQVSGEAGRGNREHSGKGKNERTIGISLSAYDARLWTIGGGPKASLRPCSPILRLLVLGRRTWPGPTRRERRREDAEASTR